MTSIIIKATILYLSVGVFLLLYSLWRANFTNRKRVMWERVTIIIICWPKFFVRSLKETIEERREERT